MDGRWAIAGIRVDGSHSYSCMRDAGGGKMKKKGIFWRSEQQTKRKDDHKGGLNRYEGLCERSCETLTKQKGNKPNFWIKVIIAYILIQRGGSHNIKHQKNTQQSLALVETRAGCG